MSCHGKTFTILLFRKQVALKVQCYKVICYICIGKDGRIIYIIYIKLLKYFSVAIGITDN